MIFEADDFADTKLDGDMRNHIAKIANKFIMDNGFTVYGHAYVEKSEMILEDFTRDKKESDLDVAFIIGIRRMGYKKPVNELETSYQTDPTKREADKAEKRYYQTLEREVQHLREIQKKHHSPKPLRDR